MVEKEKNKETLKAEEEKKRKYRNRIINKKDNKMEKNVNISVIIINENEFNPKVKRNDQIKKSILGWI